MFIRPENNARWLATYTFSRKKGVCALNGRNMVNAFYLNNVF